MEIKGLFKSHNSFLLGFLKIFGGAVTSFFLPVHLVIAPDVKIGAVLSLQRFSIV
jgi:hypothetical protein